MAHYTVDYIGPKRHRVTTYLEITGYNYKNTHIYIGGSRGGLEALKKFIPEETDGTPTDKEV